MCWHARASRASAHKNAPWHHGSWERKRGGSQRGVQPGGGREAERRWAIVGCQRQTRTQGGVTYALSFSDGGRLERKERRRSHAWRNHGSICGAHRWTLLVMDQEERSRIMQATSDADLHALVRRSTNLNLASQRRALCLLSPSAVELRQRLIRVQQDTSFKRATKAV